MNNEKQLTNPSSFLFYSLLYVADTAAVIIFFSHHRRRSEQESKSVGILVKKNEAVQKDSVQISSRITQARGLFIINQSGRQGNAHS